MTLHLKKYNIDQSSIMKYSNKSKKTPKKLYIKS